jgi:phosphate starvation-inducible membrane PsiE
MFYVLYMLVLMVDLWFKNLQLIIYFMGLETITQIVTMYDHEVSMPLLMIIYNKLTPIVFVII